MQRLGMLSVVNTEDVIEDALKEVHQQYRSTMAAMKALQDNVALNEIDS
jgi:hypothetical protein